MRRWIKMVEKRNNKRKDKRLKKEWREEMKKVKLR